MMRASTFLSILSHLQLTRSLSGPIWLAAMATSWASPTPCISPPAPCLPRFTCTAPAGWAPTMPTPRPWPMSPIATSPGWTFACTGWIKGPSGNSTGRTGGMSGTLSDRMSATWCAAGPKGSVSLSTRPASQARLSRARKALALPLASTIWKSPHLKSLRGGRNPPES